MADIKTAEERSKNMSAIKSRDTSPELFLRHLLFDHGFRYRLYNSSIPGQPDIWMKKYNTAIFVNGCFWHRHKGCKYAYMPKSKVEFWESKFAKNVSRDEAVRRELEIRQIKCLIVWECSIKVAVKRNGNPEEIINKVRQFIDSEELYGEI